MKISKTYNLNKDVPFEQQSKQIDTQINSIINVLQGRVRFGTGTDGANGENVQGQFQQFTSDGSANTEFSVTHTMGAIPKGYIVLWQDKAGSLYQGPTTGTAWTSSTVYLKCSISSVTFLIFLIQ